MDKTLSRPRWNLSLELYVVTAVLGEKGRKNVNKCINYADNLFQRKYYKIICCVEKIARKEIRNNQQETKHWDCVQDLKEKCKL